MTEYFLCLVLFCLGLYGILIKRNLIKIIISLAIMEYAMNLFFILIGYKNGGTVPIFSSLTEPRPEVMVDPVAQVIVITNLVIGIAITFVLVIIAMRIYEKYGTYDIREVNKLKG